MKLTTKKVRDLKEGDRVIVPIRKVYSAYKNEFDLGLNSDGMIATNGFMVSEVQVLDLSPSDIEARERAAFDAGDRLGQRAALGLETKGFYFDDWKEATAKRGEG